MPNWPNGTPYGNSLVMTNVLGSVTATTIPGYLMMFYLVFTKTEFRPSWTALLGFFPMIEYWGMICCTFYCTTWGPENTALAFCLQIPAHVLMTSRQITCNFTREPMDWFVKTPLWFLLFPINKYAGLPVHEGYVAAFIFFVTVCTYLEFAVSTINQITSHLGINALTPVNHALPKVDAGEKKTRVA